MKETKLSPLLSHATTGIVLFVLAIFPFTFFPFFSDFFDTPKRLVLIIATLILILVWALQTFAKKAVTITPSLLSSLWLGLAISSLVSVLANPGNRIGSLFGSGGFLIALGLFVFIASNMVEKKLSSKAVSLLTFSGILVAFLEIVDRLGASPALLLKPLLGPNTPSTGFSITGGPFVSAFFLGIVLVMLIVKLLTYPKTQEKMLTGAYTVIIGIGLLSCLYLFLPGKPTQPQFLPFGSAWNIGIDTLKSGKTALIGVGPDNYINAFSAFRPVSMNQTPLWQIRFESSRNGVLQLLTTQGILGAGLYILLVVTIVKTFFQIEKESYPIYVGLVSVLLFTLFFPFTLLSLALTALFTVLLISDLKSQGKLTQHSFLFASVKSKREESQVISASRIGPALVSLLLIAGVVVLSFFIVQFARAEMIMASSVRQLSANNIKDGYLGVQQAVKIMPYIDRNHRQLSVVGISIAQALAKKEDASEQDKQTTVQLIQQSINESKSAVALNSGSTTNWETLSSIYRILIGSVEKADEWTVAGFTQAIRTDPSNPLLRLELGNVYAQAKNYNQASRLYEQSASLKPDLPAPYYAMSQIAKLNNDFVTQKALLEKVLTLLPQDNKDRSAVEKQLEEATKSIPASGSAQKATPKPSPSATKPADVEDLTKPAPTPLPVKVALPTDSGVASDSASTQEVPRE